MEVYSAGIETDLIPMILTRAAIGEIDGEIFIVSMKEEIRRKRSLPGESSWTSN